MPEIAQPAQYEDCADALAGLPGVVAADVLDRDPRVDRPLLEVVVGPGYVRVPPRVLRAVAAHDLGIRRIAPQGTEGHLAVEVV